MHEEGERPNIRRFKAKSIAKQPIDILGRQRAEPKFAYGRIGLSNGVQRERERVLRSHLVVAVSTDEQQMAYVATGDEILDQRQGRRIEPLKVVDKNNQRVLWPREDVDETLKYQLKPKSGLRWRECSHRRLGTYQANELRNGDLSRGWRDCRPLPEWRRANGRYPPLKNWRTSL
jgi:hypothetical protein